MEEINEVYLVNCAMKTLHIKKKLQKALKQIKNQDLIGPLKEAIQHLDKAHIFILASRAIIDNHPEGGIDKSKIEI